MALELTDEQTLLGDEARRFLDDRAGPDALRRAVESGNGHDAGLWRTVAGELGWCALPIDEAHGGLGLGAVETTLLLEQCGRRLACIPLWSTMCLATPVIAALAAEEPRGRLLAAVAAGQLRATVALADPGAVDPLRDVAVTARPDDAGYRLAGTVDHVVDLQTADLVLVPALADAGELALFALEAGHRALRERLEGIDPTRPLGRLAVDGLRVDKSARIDAGGLDAADFARPLATARLGLAAEQVGTAQGALDLTLAYIGERVQFGRTIASFQAIKHRCARHLVAIAEARSMLRGTAAGLADMSCADAELELAGLGALATQAAFSTAAEAIQLHGGVGMTWEYDPHFYFRRAQVGAFFFGSAEDRLELIAARMIDGGRDA